MGQRMTHHHSDTPGHGALSLGKRVVFGAVVVLVAVLVALALAEVLLRVLPIRGIAYQTFYYDELTGGRHYPNATVVYRGADAETVERRVNDWGFLDVDHSLEKPPGTVRIAFFGDSYTEARQVELEETFFRRLQATLDSRSASNPRYEVLAFGVAGRSTLQSYLECTRWMNRAGIDLVVYVFSENDPADQMRVVTKVDVIPYAQIAGDSFVVDDEFRRRYAYKTSRLHRTAQFLKARSLVMSTIEQRLRLLRRHGVRVDAGPEGVEGREEGLRATAPSTWGSDSLVAVAETLCGRVIERWRHEVETSGASFAIVRVPRESQLQRPREEQDAWAPWLHRFCREQGILLVDPTDRFREAMGEGEVLYGDHFTPAGHRAFARAIAHGMLGIDY
jgi:hypothetical protein